MSGDATLSARIRRCAQIVGSGNALARKTGIPRSTLETYISGNVEPIARRLVTLARAAGVSVEWLATGEGPSAGIPKDAVSTGPAEFRQRVALIAKLVGGPIELARFSKMSRPAIDKYTAGTADPSRARLVALARAAGVSVAWLATGEGPMALDTHRHDATAEDPDDDPRTPPSKSLVVRALARLFRAVLLEALRREQS